MWQCAKMRHGVSGATQPHMATEGGGGCAGAKSLDLILNTVSVVHDVSGLLPMLAVDGRLVMLGLVTAPFEMSVLPLVFYRAGVVGSLIGGIKRTQVR